MRLGDLDALKKKLQARHDNGDDEFDKGYNIGIESAIDLIDNATTVEPFCPYLSDDEVKQPCLESPCELDRPQGEWINYSATTFTCSNCKKNCPNFETYMKMNFCPNCGAKMKKRTKTE